MASNQVLQQLIFSIETNTAKLTAGINDAKSQFSSLSQGIKQIGGVIAGAFAVSAIISAGKAVFNFANEIGEANAKVRDLTNLTGDDLKNVTASIKATSDTFKTDFNETLKTTNALAHTYGISFQEASQLVQQGVALQDDDASQLLGIIKQFSPSFKTLGLTAEQTFAIISQTMDSGIIPETAIGAIGKATQNLREMNANAQTALKNIGINAEELALSIRNGSITEYQAIQQIAEKMKGFNASSKEVGDTLMQVFGKQGVQAGAQFIESLSTMSTKWGEVMDQADSVEKSNLRIAAAQTEINKELVGLFGESSTYMASLKADAYELALKALKSVKQSVVDVANYFIDLYNNSLFFRAIVQDLMFVFKSLWEYVKFFGTNLIDLFRNAGALIKAVFTGNFAAIPDLFNNAMKKLQDNTFDLAKNVATNFIDGVKATMSTEKISLISNDDVKADATKAAQTYSQAFGDAFNDGGKDKKGAKTKSEKFDLGIKVAALQNIQKGFASLNTTILGATKNAAYMPTVIQKIGDAFKNNIQGTAYQSMRNLGQQIGESVATGKANIADLGNQALSTAKQMIAASLANALAETIAANAALPFPYDVAAIAAGTAAIYAAFSAIPAFENGGVSSGGLSLVGERGAELVSLPSGSRVHNHSDTSRILSGSGKMQVEVIGMVKGEDIYFSQQNVSRRRSNSSY